MSDGLCSHIPRGRSATVYPHVVPSLCFATAPPAVSRAHLPATSTDYPAATDGVGGLAIPRPAIRGPISHCVSTVVLPHTLPRPFCRFVKFRARHRQLCRSSAGGAGATASGTGWRSPPPFTPLPAIQLTTPVKDVLGRNRESRSRTGN